MFMRVLKMSFWVGYDHLGKLLVANLCCALLSALPILLGVAILLAPATTTGLLLGWGLLVAGVVLTPVVWAGLINLANTCIEHGDAAFGEFFQGARREARRALLLGLLYGGIAACLLVAAWFYPTQLAHVAPLAGYVLAGFAALGLLLLVLSALYAGPALLQRPTGPLGTLQLAVALVLDKPLFTLSLATAHALLATLAVAPPVLLFIVYAGAAVLQCSAYELLARHYDREGRLGEGPADDYLNRGWNDLLHPWKM